jgi:hypothetical protein
MSQLKPAGNDPGAKFQKEFEKTLENKIPGYKTIETVQIALSAVLNLALILFGVGLLKLQPWGRIGCIGYAIVSLVGGLAATVYSFLYVVPAMKEAIADLTRTQPQMPKEVIQIMEMTMTAAPFLGLCGLIYPIVVLVIMLSPKVSRAFSGKGEPMDTRGDDYGDYPPRNPYDDDTGYRSYQ